MNGSIFAEIIIWFFAIIGLTLLFLEALHFFSYKSTLPAKLTVLLPAEAVQESGSIGIAALLGLLYEENPDGKYEIIIVEDAQTPTNIDALRCITNASDCVYIANSENITAYIKESFC